LRENKGCKDTRPERKKWVHVYPQKGENKPILSEALLEIREMIITQKEFKKNNNHSNL
jgi:predicted Fe-S protein YdhL (DUF1289 family)